MKKLFTLLLVLEISVVYCCAKIVKIGDLYYNINDIAKTAKVVKDQNRISVTDNSIADWKNIPVEEIYEVKCPDNATFSGLKSAKVYADDRHVNILLEPDMDNISNIAYLQIFLDTDNSNLTGGEFWFSDANADIVLEGILKEGNIMFSYTPSVSCWWGEVGERGEWLWANPSVEHDDSDCWGALVCELKGCSSQYVNGMFEIQFSREQIPVTWNDSIFGIGFALVNGDWEPTGFLPLVSPSTDNEQGITSKLKITRYDGNYTNTIHGNLTIPSMIEYQGELYVVNRIGESAFLDCGNLESILLPNGITYIEDYAFENCYNLSSVNIPQDVAYLANSAFSGCTGISSITWDAKRCDSAPFYDARNSITSFVFGKDVEIVPSSICSGMSALSSITIPNSVVEIGENAFGGCSGITSIVIPPEVTVIKDNTFQNCSGITTIIIPNTIESIGNSAFSGCSKIMSLTIGNKVTSIGNYTFANCSALLAVTIPNSTKSIGEKAFYECSRLETITLGTNLETLGNYAFEDCKHILDIYSYANAVPVIEENTFKNVSRYAYLYVPSDMMRRYQIDEYWNDFILKPMEANTVVTDGNVKVQPGNNDALISWPTSGNANSYSLTITKDGIIFCVLTFNSQGQLIGLAFAPNRDGNAHAPAAILTEQGYQFKITGLDMETLYAYQIDATDNLNNVIASYNGTFTTTGGEQGINNIKSSEKLSSKTLRNGQLLILRGDHTYTVDGRVVR